MANKIVFICCFLMAYAVANPISEGERQLTKPPTPPQKFIPTNFWKCPDGRLDACKWVDPATEPDFVAFKTKIDTSKPVFVKKGDGLYQIITGVCDPVDKLTYLCKYNPPITSTLADASTAIIRRVSVEIRVVYYKGSWYVYIRIQW